MTEKVRKSKVKDDEVVKAVEEMKRTGVKMLRDEEWREVDGICKGDWGTRLQENPQRLG